MRSIIRTNPLARAAAAFVVGGLAVLVVHQPVVAVLHALGSTPIAAYSLRATRPWGIPVFLSLSFWGGIWTIPIAWILDHLPRGWIYWVGAVCLGALPPTLTTWFVIFPLKGLSRSDAAASVGVVNALIVNGVSGLAFAFAWSWTFAAPPVTPPSIVGPGQMRTYGAKTHPWRLARQRAAAAPIAGPGSTFTQPPATGRPT
jgi:hypothetical protein